jgi:hypothetical protein
VWVSLGVFQARIQNHDFRQPALTWINVCEGKVLPIATSGRSEIIAKMPVDLDQ